MGDLSLRLKIANKEYPLKVKSEQEENVREAAHWVNERIRTFRNKFSIEEKEDLLAMVAFDCAMSGLKDKKGESNEEVLNKVRSLNQMVQEALIK